MHLLLCTEHIMNNKSFALVIKVTVITLMLVAVFSAGVANAGILKSEYVNEDGDTVCVYDSHFKKVYVNVGKTGICDLTIEDE